MDYFAKKQWFRIAICAVLVAAITLAMTGVFNGNKELVYQDKTAQAEEGTETGGEAQSEMLQAIVVSMGNESKNDYVTDYLKQDPYLVNIYEGYGFAKDYGSARGHAYTLEDVQKTGRPHAKANCLTCKTPDMHKMIEEQGVGVYSMPFEDVMAQTTNTISCYNCHGADDGNNGQMAVTHQYVNEALGENVSTVNAASLSCGQCHIEYYFTPEDSEAMMPYHSIEEMTPEAILAYYDGMGFSDWEQPGTGTKMLKAQHPELETWIQGKHASILSCADCHMPVKTTESGIEYHDHHLVSPLSSEAILNRCAECHGSGEAITARVREIQAKVTGRETEVGNRLSSLKDTLTAAVEAGQIGGEELEAVRKLHREAQWFFDYCYVENSEGAHNSSLSMRCLDTSDEKITEALGMLAAAGVEVAPEAMSGTQEEETASDGSVTEQGFGGDVTVRLEMNGDGTVKTLTIDTPNETDGLGKRASEAEFTEQFIGKAAPFAFGENGIEALSGATVTSTAALTAINKAAAAPAAGDTNGEENASDNSVTEQGFGGDVTVRLEMNGDGTVKTLTIDTPNETDGLGKRASEAEFTEQFIGKAAPFAFGENGIEALSGATVTSTAALTAINKAAAAPAAQEAPVEKTEEPKEEEKTEEPAAEEKTEEKTEAAASDGQVYGSYRVTKENEYSKVTVTVGTKNGAMTSCKIVSEGEQDLLTDEIRGEWAKAILESGSATPDAISGATLKVSAQSVQDAVTGILAQMNSEAAAPAETGAKAEEPAEEPKKEEKTEEPATEEKKEEPAAEEKTEEKAETAASDGQAYGSYRVTKANDFSTVTVTVSTKNGAMTSCKITSEGEQDLLTDEIRGEWAKAILESGSATPDAITGATLKVSARSVQDAVTDILAQMNGEAAATAATEEKTEAPTEEPIAAPAEEPTEAPAAEPKEEEKTEEPAAEEKKEEPAAEEKKEEPAAEEKAEEKAETAASDGQAYGTYRVTKANDFSKVTVTVGTKNGAMTSCRIISEGDQDLLTDEIRNEWAKAILESGSAAPDAITGATLKVSAKSVQEAVEEILAKITGE